MTKTKLIKTASGMEVRIWEGTEPRPMIEGRSAYKQWLSSYKSYPVRSEDEEGFMELALHEFCKQNNKDERFVSEFSIPFVKALSQGIEIDSERVGFDNLYRDGVGNKYFENEREFDPTAWRELVGTFSTLLTEDKEGEGQGDLWDELFDHIENTPVDVPWADCIKELKQKFKITKK